MGSGFSPLLQRTAPLTSCFISGFSMELLGGSSADGFVLALTLSGSFQGAVPHPTPVTSRLGVSPQRSFT